MVKRLLAILCVGGLCLPLWGQAQESALGAALKAQSASIPVSTLSPASRPQPKTPEKASAPDQALTDKAAREAVARYAKSPEFLSAINQAVSRAIARKNLLTQEDLARAMQQAGTAGAAPPVTRAPSHSTASTQNRAPLDVFYSLFAPTASGKAQGDLINHATQLGFTEILAATTGKRPGVYVGRFPAASEAFAALTKIRSVYPGEVVVMDSTGQRITGE